MTQLENVWNRKPSSQSPPLQQLIFHHSNKNNHEYQQDHSQVPSASSSVKTLPLNQYFQYYEESGGESQLPSFAGNILSEEEQSGNSSSYFKVQSMQNKSVSSSDRYASHANQFQESFQTQASFQKIPPHQLHQYQQQQEQQQQQQQQDMKQTFDYQCQATFSEYKGNQDNFTLGAASECEIDSHQSFQSEQQQQQQSQSNEHKLQQLLEIDQAPKVVQIHQFPPRELHAIVHHQNSDSMGESEKQSSQNQQEQLSEQQDRRESFSFREGHGVLTRHPQLVNDNNDFKKEDIYVDQEHGYAYNYLKLQPCKNSPQKIKQHNFVNDSQPSSGSSSPNSVMNRKKNIGNTPNFNDVKNQLSANMLQQQQGLDQGYRQKSPKSSSNFQPDPESLSPSKNRNQFVRNKLDPSASPHKPKGIQPRVRTGLDSKPKFQITNNRIPRTKNGQLGDFAVVVEQDGDGFQMRYNVVGIQKLSKKDAKKTALKSGKDGLITQQQQMTYVKKSQNPRQNSHHHMQRAVKNTTVIHQPSHSITEGANTNQFSSTMKLQHNQQQNIQKNKKKTSTSVHKKKPSIYEMPLKISSTTSPSGYKSVKATTTAAICSPANTAPRSHRSTSSSKGATPTSHNNRSITPSSISHPNSGSQTSQTNLANHTLQKQDINTLKQLQLQLRKKLIGYSSDLSSSFLKQIRNIQKPAPQLVKVLEIFCGLVSVVQFASGVTDAWIKRPKSWNSIQATLSSPSQFVQNCRVFKELCEQDRYDNSKISALSCQFQKIQIKNVPNVQFQPIYFLYSFAKAMLNYVTIREHMKRVLQQQDIESHVQQDEDSFSERKDVTSEDQHKNSKSSLASGVFKFKNFDKSPNPKTDSDIISISQSLSNPNNYNKISGRQKNTTKSKVSQSLQQHQQQQLSLRSYDIQATQSVDDPRTLPSDKEYQLDDEISMLQQSVQRMKKQKQQEMSQVSNASSTNHSKITSKEAERNLTEQQTKIERFVNDKHKRLQERGMISFDSPKNLHSSSVMNSLKGSSNNNNATTKTAKPSTLYQNYQKKQPMLSKRNTDRLNYSAIDVLQTSNNNIKPTENKRKKTPANLNRSFNHNDKFNSSQKLNLYSTKKNLQQRTLRSNSKNKYSSTTTQSDTKNGRSVTPKLQKQKSNDSKSSTCSTSANNYSTTSYKKNPTRSTGTASRLWNKDGAVTSTSGKNIKIDSNLSLQSSTITTPSQRKLNSCKNISDKKHNFSNYNSSSIKSTSIKMTSSHIKSPSSSSSTKVVPQPTVNTYKRSKTPGSYASKQVSDSGSRQQGVGMKRCSSQQYIPPTRRLINMKNKKLKWQQQAAEKDRERESLLSGMRTLNNSSFQTRANSSMWVSPDQGGLNSSAFIEKTTSKTMLNSPATSKPGVRYFNHEDQDIDFSRAGEEQEEVKEIRRSQSSASIHSSPQKLDRYSGNSILSPLNISSKINTPQPFKTFDNNQVDSAQQLISNVKIGNFLGSSVKTGSFLPSSSILSKNSSKNTTTSNQKRTESDNDMIKALISKRRMKREQQSRERNLAKKQRYIKDEFVGSQSVVQQEQNENNQDSPTKSFLAGKPMKKKRSAASISLTNSTGNFESQESSSYQVNDSPGTWADKKIKQDQKRIMKAMNMLQTRK